MSVYAIDASSANKQNRTGVEEYSFQIIEALKKLELTSDESFLLYSLDPLNNKLSQLPDSWQNKILNWKIRRGWRSFRFSYEMARNKPDLLFVPGQALPLTTPELTLTTIHDIGFKRYPELYTPHQFRRLSNATNKAVKKAKKIFVVSDFTKTELQSVYGVPDEKIIITPNAVNQEDYLSDFSQNDRAVLDRYRLGGNFFLFVGRLERKKNPSVLIRAFEHFKDRRGYGDPFELVFAGSPGFGYNELERAIENSNVKSDIRVLGFVPREDLNAMFRKASALLFPSKYEGFGIPLLEGMASKTPVLCSDLAIHHEVGQDAVVLLPNDPFAWSRAMTEIVDDQSHRDFIIQRGISRIQAFSWQSSAEKILATFREVCRS